MKLGEAIYKRLRMDPFKTKLAPDFDIKWGFEPIESHYPTRKTKTPQLFDLKAFVDEKRKNDMPSMPRPGMGPGFGDNFNPFGGMNNRPEPPLDFDSMMKDIEKRIQEIEEEEKKEAMAKEQLENAKTPLPNLEDEEEPRVVQAKDISEVNKDLTPINIYNEPVEEELPPLKEEPVKQPEKPIINVDSDSVIVNENVVTDDEFFDDFFGDDE